MTREEQFAYIDAARADLLQWAKEQPIPLHAVEFVVPFVKTDFGLGIWIFFETDDQLRRSEEMAWPDRIQAHFREILGRVGYAEEWLTNVAFSFDSHENVVVNYKGNYFYRLR